MEGANTMRWDGRPGHYEVWYATLTDPRTATGVWIRYALRAPLVAGEQAECALWLAAMTPGGERYARRADFPGGALGGPPHPVPGCLARAAPSRPGAAGGPRAAARGGSGGPPPPPGARGPPPPPP